MNIEFLRFESGTPAPRTPDFPCNRLCSEAQILNGRRRERMLLRLHAQEEPFFPPPPDSRVNKRQNRPHRGGTRRQKRGDLPVVRGIGTHLKLVRFVSAKEVNGLRIHTSG